MAILSVVRWPNLLLLALIQCAAGYFLSQTPPLLLAGIITMTGCAAASGYIINNILDQATDSLNKKPNAISQKHITGDQAWLLYRMLIGLGGIMMVILSIEASLHFIWIYALMVGLLWAYTRSLKGTRLAGNLSVSLLCGLAVVIVAIPGTQEIQQALWWLSGFAFALTWLREIVKDLEDKEGDMKAGYQTLPVASGTKPAKGLGLVISVTILVGLLLPGVFPVEGEWWQFGMWGVTALLIAYSGIVAIVTATTSAHYHRISTLLKIAMLTGTCFFIL